MTDVIRETSNVPFDSAITLGLNREILKKKRILNVIIFNEIIKSKKL